MFDFAVEVFFLLTLVLIMILGGEIYVFVVRKKSFKEWRGEEGEGASASALLGVFSIVAIAGIIALLPSTKAEAKSYSDMFTDGKWLNGTSVYLGIDYTKKVISSVCKWGSDDRQTSNLGIRQNLWTSQDNIFEVNGKYTHHSCVFGKDRNGYDGFGVEVQWNLVDKK